MKLPGNYPKYVTRIVKDDLLQRDRSDPVRLAYELAERVHRDRKRKNETTDYITHPLRIYDMLRRCVPPGTPDRDAIFAAALLHDVVEDYRIHDIEKDLVTLDDARSEGRAAIMKAFADPAFAAKVLGFVDELTNPLVFRDTQGRAIDKRHWKIHHTKHISSGAKLIRICDQAANLISTIEEAPKWDDHIVRDYYRTTCDVVDAAIRKVPVNDPLRPAIDKAASMFSQIAGIHKDVVARFHKRGRVDPPGTPHASFHMDTIDKLATPKGGFSKG